MKTCLCGKRAIVEVKTVRLDPWDDYVSRWEPCCLHCYWLLDRLAVRVLPSRRLSEVDAEAKGMVA